MEKYPDFEQWFEELKRVAGAKGLSRLINSDDPDSYRDGWEEGYTPEEELDEQLYAAQ